MRRGWFLSVVLGSLLLQGCNAGVAGVLLLLLLDDGGGSSKKKSQTADPAFRVEFINAENSRKRPAETILRFRLRGLDGERADIRFEISEEGRPFTAASLFVPTGGTLSAEPGVLKGVPAATAGQIHLVHWNALQDLGSDDLHRVVLRITVLTGKQTEVIAEVLVGNDAPRIIDAAITQEEGEDVRIALLLSDSSADPTDVRIDFALKPAPGGPPEFNPALETTGTTELSTSEAGDPHLALWNAGRDAGPYDQSVIVRLTPRDMVEGEIGKVGAFLERPLRLDNNRSPAVELLEEDLLTGIDFRRGIALRLRVRDGESNPVDAIIQWTVADAPFPALDTSLDGDAELRASLVTSDAVPAKALRRTLQVASLLPEIFEGPVESSSHDLAPEEVLASWILAGLARGGDIGLAGRGVELHPIGDGAVQFRSVCAFEPARGILLLDRPFDPAAEPGSVLRIESGGPGGPLRLSSDPVGASHVLIWDGETDVPGGGPIRFRVTPFDIVAAPDARCGELAAASAPDVEPGARGIPAQTGGAKRTRGPLSDEDPWIAALAGIDTPSVVGAADVDADGSLDLVVAARGSDALLLLLQKRPGLFDTVRLYDARLRGPSGLVVRDFDGDGALDFAVSGEESRGVLLIFQRPGFDVFSDRALLTAGGALVRPSGITASDLDGNGTLDFAVAESGGPDPGLRLFFRGTGPGGAGCGPSEAGYQSCLLRAPAGDVPRAIAAARVFDDSTSDIVAAGNGFFGIYSLQVAGGDLTFRYTRVDAPGTELLSVTAADLDGNGKADLVGLDRAGSSVRVASQTIPPGFGLLEPLVASSLRNPIGLVHGDLDGNGTVDLAVADAGDPASSLGGNVSVFLGDASGAYSFDVLERRVSVGHAAASPQAVAAVDVDGDGGLDVVSADGGTHELVVYRHAGRGSFRGDADLLGAGQAVKEPASLATADLDADGRLDLVAANRSADGLTLFVQGSAGTFSAFDLPLPPAGVGVRRGPAAAAAGDVNGDGRMDLVTANVDSNDLTVLLQDANGEFLATDLKPAEFPGPHAVELADLSGDGRLDIVAAARFADEARWFRQGPDGGFQEAGVFAVGAPGGMKVPGPIQVAAGDLNRDGRADVVIASHRADGLALFLQEGAPGSFAAPETIGLGAGVRPSAVALADLDQNGLPDIVTANLGPAAVSILHQGPAGAFEASSIAGPGGAQATSIAVSDLQGDGRLDLAVALSGSAGSSLRLYLQADGFDPGRLRDLVSPRVSAPIAVLAVDLDSDGEPDLASANRLSRNVTAFYGGR